MATLKNFAHTSGSMSKWPGARMAAFIVEPTQSNLNCTPLGFAIENATYAKRRSTRNRRNARVISKYKDNA
jgi:hypothetical protein